jgi:[citrate (pro-3S)-lyase] ligase
VKIFARDMVVNGRYVPLLYKWKRFSNRYKIGDLLSKMGHHNIAIYGGGVIGTLLYEELIGSEINVVVIIDKEKEPIFPYDLEVIQVEDLHDSYGIDAVVLTPLLAHADSVNLEEGIKRRINCEVLMLDGDLIPEIDIIDGMKKAVKYVFDSNAQIIFLDVSPRMLLKIKNPSTYEKLLMYYGDNWIQHRNKFSMVFDELFNDIGHYSEKYFNEISSYSQVEKNGAIYLADKTELYQNVVNGCRITTDVPEKYDNTIYTYGGCWVFGVYAEDKYTVQSYLQRALNNNLYSLDRSFRIMNCGIINADAYKYLMYKQLMQESLKDGDIVILMTLGQGYLKFFNENNSGCAAFYDISTAFDRPHEFGEVFVDLRHWGHKGNKLVANMIYKILCNLDAQSGNVQRNEKNRAVKGIGKNVDPKPHEYLDIANADIPQSTELDDYLCFIRSEKIDIDGVVGAVVMNCNPFTLGHRHLIERALAECDFLYVFVVEEDKSEYSFEDRISLVKKGVSDLLNVKVLPSGKFIISTLTLPEYFAKSEKITIDATRDIETFAKYIAPAIGITKRFAGDEPTCYVTRQYNQAMKEVLPKYAIEFVVFKRLEIQGKPVSASTVREFTKDGNYEGIKNLVPESTFEFLIKQGAGSREQGN